MDFFLLLCFVPIGTTTGKNIKQNKTKKKKKKPKTRSRKWDVCVWNHLWITTIIIIKNQKTKTEQKKQQNCNDDNLIICQTSFSVLFLLFRNISFCVKYWLYLCREEIYFLSILIIIFRMFLFCCFPIQPIRYSLWKKHQPKQKNQTKSKNSFVKSCINRCCHLSIIIEILLLLAVVCFVNEKNKYFSFFFYCCCCCCWYCHCFLFSLKNLFFLCGGFVFCFFLLPVNERYWWLCFGFWLLLAFGVWSNDLLSIQNWIK